MSKHETWRTRMYWEKVGGLLIEEFVAIRGTKEQGKRLLDGVIVLNEKKGIHDGNTYDLQGKDVIVIQTKRGRLGMNLLGQAHFSKLLIAKHRPKSIKGVAICGRDDIIINELAKEHEIEVVIISEETKSLK